MDVGLFPHRQMDAAEEASRLSAGFRAFVPRPSTKSPQPLGAIHREIFQPPRKVLRFIGKSEQN